MGCASSSGTSEPYTDERGAGRADRRVGDREGGDAGAARGRGGAGGVSAGGAGAGGAGGAGGGGRGRHTGDGRSRPLRKEPPWQFEHDLTDFELACLREEFWDSDRKGSRHVWEAIKVAAEAMANDDYELGNTVMQESGISTPGGNLSRCIDHAGMAYEVPRHVYSTPANVLKGAAGPASKTATASGAATDLEVKVRFAYSEREIPYTASSHSAIGDLKAQIHAHVLKEGEDFAERKHAEDAEAGLPPAHQRLFFSGRELTDDSLTLEACGFVERAALGIVLQLLIRPTASQAAAAASGAGDGDA